VSSYWKSDRMLWDWEFAIVSDLIARDCFVCSEVS
jgi:hypothetical protein